MTLEKAMKLFIPLILSILLSACASSTKKVIYVSEGERTFPTLESTYDKVVDIGNIHSLRDDNRILRGANPKGKMASLKSEGVTDVLLFREAKPQELTEEKHELNQIGIQDERIHYVPMKWKDISSQEESCRQVV